MFPSVLILQGTCLFLLTIFFSFTGWFSILFSCAQNNPSEIQIIVIKLCMKHKELTIQCFGHHVPFISTLYVQCQNSLGKRECAQYSLVCNKCIHNQEMTLCLSKLSFILWIIVSLKKMNYWIKHHKQQFKTMFLIINLKLSAKTNLPPFLLLSLQIYLKPNEIACRFSFMSIFYMNHRFRKRPMNSKVCCNKTVKGALWQK